MKLVKWEELPSEMRTESVRKYYDILEKRKGSLILKRVFDIISSLILLVLLSPIFLILAMLIKIDSPGPVFYRQERITQYGKKFRIHKFRTMLQNSDQGSQVTVNNDNRVTRVGRFIRRCRLDEIAQLLDTLAGTLTLVGVRPESPRFVVEYTDEMMATLLLPAGVTSLASIYYKDEAELLDGTEDTDKVYIEKILPGKMYYNLKGIEQFSFWRDIRIIFMTVFAVLGKKYKGEYEEVYIQQAEEKVEEESKV
jgi:sugar transferases involved in lipopolysaccharide synthesis